MKQTYLFLTIIFAVLAMTIGQTLRVGCPNVVTKPDFNISRYQGDWYEDRRTFALFQFGLTCSKANYRILSNRTIQVTNTGITNWFRFPISAQGIATVPDPSEPGRLSVSFNGRDGSPYLVLDTDYDNFALVYTCESRFGLLATDIMWILTRRRGFLLQGDLRTKIKNMLDRYNIPTNRFIRTDHSGC